MLRKSTRKGKRYMITYNGKIIHFGSDVGRTYIDHGDNTKKKNWIARHSKLSKFDNPNKASFWSRFVLWNRRDINSSLKDALRRANI